MSFQIHALPAAPFQQLFSLSDEELLAHKAVRRKATAFPGAPCRISLQDANEGEEVILVQYKHMAVNSPYASSHAIYVRKDVEQAKLSIGEIPELISKRLISVRAFSANDMLVNADVVEGTSLVESIQKMFSIPQAEYLHLHYAQPGCFAASVTRV